MSTSFVPPRQEGPLTTPAAAAAAAPQPTPAAQPPPFDAQISPFPPQSFPCAACKFLRRKCTAECVLSPHFPPDAPLRFASVHRVFGASNVARLLADLPSEQRADAANSLAYEAEARIQDPVYGCVSAISFLQQQALQLQSDLFLALQELAQLQAQQITANAAATAATATTAAADPATANASFFATTAKPITSAPAAGVAGGVEAVGAIGAVGAMIASATLPSATPPSGTPPSATPPSAAPSSAIGAPDDFSTGGVFACASHAYNTFLSTPGAAESSGVAATWAPALATSAPITSAHVEPAATVPISYSIPVNQFDPSSLQGASGSAPLVTWPELQPGQGVPSVVMESPPMGAAPMA